MRHSISPCNLALPDPGSERAIFRRELGDLRNSASGMPIWQIGRPLDFLADSEEPHSSRGSGRGNPVEAAARLPELVEQLSDLGVTLSVYPESTILYDTSTGGNEGGGPMSLAGRIENRCFTRFTMNAPATIWRDTFTVAGHIVNISLGGAFLRMDPQPPLHEIVTVSMHDSVRPAGLLNDLPATVIRTCGDGFAVRFDRMLLERGIGDSMNDNLLSAR